MKKSIFIDGHVGTTGLQIHERLAKEPNIELITLSDEQRKDKTARENCLNKADLAVLCLPDDAAREAVSMVSTPHTKLLDASSAHRTEKNWVYGMPEWDATQPQRIAAAKYVSNPGCYAIGALALLRPLISSGQVPRDHPISIHAVSGYTGGGQNMIAAYTDPAHPEYTQSPITDYALNLEHKHLKEIHLHSGLASPPLFSPAVGSFAQGMIVHIPLHLSALPQKPSADDIEQQLISFYSAQNMIQVMTSSTRRLDAAALAGQDIMQLYVFRHDQHQQVLLAALLDNLGKGAAGTAIQNIRLMLAENQQQAA